jgi:hypothetical protein
MNSKPFIIEFTGTPDSGKTSTIQTLVSRLESKGLKTYYIHERTKNAPNGIDRKKWTGYLWIRLRMLLEVLESASSDEYDVILIDRGIYDGLFWLELFYEDYRCSELQYQSMKNFLLNCFPKFPDILLTFYVSSDESVKRKEMSGNNNTDKPFIEFYNDLLVRFYDGITNQEKRFVDTTNLSIVETVKFVENLI